MGGIKPALIILESWAKNYPCPVCLHQKLGVVHETGVPDLVACPDCDCEFLIEQGGSRFRLIKTPFEYENILWGRWLTFDQIREEIEALKDKPMDEEFKPTNNRNIPLQHARQLSIDIDNFYKTISEDQVFEKARFQALRLAELGNSEDNIREILEKNKQLSASELELLMNEISKKKSKKSFAPRLFAIGAIVVTIALLAITLNSVVIPKLLAQSGTGITNGAAVIIPVTGAPLENSAECPTTPLEASTLFGGKTERWHYKDTVWLYQDILFADIYVPPEMHAAYPSLSADFFIKRSIGPLNVNNTFAISISCP